MQISSPSRPSLLIILNRSWKRASQLARWYPWPHSWLARSVLGPWSVTVSVPAALQKTKLEISSPSPLVKDGVPYNIACFIIGCSLGLSNVNYFGFPREAMEPQPETAPFGSCPATWWNAMQSSFLAGCSPACLLVGTTCLTLLV